MRILAGRNYWKPRHRIEGLSRIAFLGDSNIFGQGVCPDETLPARAEPLLNENSKSFVEAVNLGVSGYNIWNSWSEFKKEPRVYDGVVFSLCNNDAQLLGRTYTIDYRNADPQLWNPKHPYHALIVDAFDDIAAFARDERLPIAICFYNLWPGEGFDQIGETIRSLSEARGLPFVNFHAHFIMRRLSQDDLIVGPADHHPSKLAHDAAARHLCQSLRALDWPLDHETVDQRGDPERVWSIAGELVRRDSYPADVAMNWAATSLDAKLRAARRSAAMEPDNPFHSRARETNDRIRAARLAWQGDMRRGAITDLLAAGDRGISGALNHAEEEVLRLDELARAAERIAWNEFGPLLAHWTTGQAAQDLRARLAQLRLRLANLVSDLETIASRGSVQNGETAWPQSEDDERRVRSDLDALRRFARLAAENSVQFQAALERVERILASGRLEDKGPDRDRFEALVHAAASLAFERFERLHGTIVAAGGSEILDGPYTTVELAIEMNRIEGRHPCLAEVRMNYRVPQRLPLRDARYFLPDGTRKLLTLRLPLVYAGRALISLRYPPAVADKIEASLAGVQIYNSAGMRRSLAREELSREGAAQFATPPFWLV